MNVMEIEDEHGPQTYQKYPVVIVRGSGSELWDDAGNEYIDCMGGYGVAIVGHCNPEVVAAIKAQAEKLITCHSSLYNDARAAFFEKLASCTPKGLDAAFLSNSGAEANEVAIKLAKKYTGKKGDNRDEGGVPREDRGGPLGHLEQEVQGAVRAAGAQTSATWRSGASTSSRRRSGQTPQPCMLEPIQGEGGIILPPDGYLKGVRELCDRRGILLIADEVQSGLGRTGKLWAFENWDVVPDVMTSAKGLAGGVPIGATIARKEIMHSLKKGEQTSTFGGNPLSCAAGSATLDYIIKERPPGQAP